MADQQTAARRLELGIERLIIATAGCRRRSTSG
jgi:hypothetical protein